jgi:hypothetical protein
MGLAKYQNESIDFFLKPSYFKINPSSVKVITDQ